MNKSQRLIVLIAGACVIINLLVVGVCVYFWQSSNKLVQEKLAESNSTSIKELQANDLKDKEKLLYTETEVLSLEKLDNLMSEKPDFKSELYKAMINVKPENIAVTSVKFSDNTISLTCKTAKDAPPGAFAKNLENLNRFSLVSYKGFSSQTDGITFSISCELKTPNASKEGGKS